jgi:hypothetical protein
MTCRLANQSDMTISTLSALPLISATTAHIQAVPTLPQGSSTRLQEGTHNYCIWDGNKVTITRDVVFPITSGDDFVKSGDGTYSAPIDLKLGDVTTRKHPYGSTLDPCIYTQQSWSKRT